MENIVFFVLCSFIVTLGSSYREYGEYCAAVGLAMCQSQDEQANKNERLIRK
jgi:hypothetical protein